jgi:DNA-binding transcriptional MerR regulator
MDPVWISDLAAACDLPVATVKYYLREGLLHPGEATGATRARYDDSHVRRLRLVRALSEVAGLRLDAIRAVLEAVDDESRSWHEAVGSAHARLARADVVTGSPSLPRVDELLRRRGWHVRPGSPHRADLARALDALASLDHPASDDLLDRYAQAVEGIAEKEVTAVTTTDRATAVEHVVVGTLLLEPVLLSIRRMAQEDASYRLRR